MRQTILGGIMAMAMALLVVPSASAQFGGYGGMPFGPQPTPFGGGGFGAGIFGGPFSGGFGLAGGPGGFSPSGSGFSAGAPGSPSNVSQVCTDSQGNRVFVTSGNSTSGYTGCTTVPTNQGPGCSGAYTVALAATGLGSSAVTGTLTFSPPNNGSFTVTGTLSGVTAGQTITLTIPLTSGTATVSATAASTTATFSSSVTGTPMTGGTVTVVQSNLSGSVAQGTVAPGCGPGLGGTPPQLCTDSQGNRVIVPNGGSPTGYTNCATAPVPPGGAGFGGGPGMGGPSGFGRRPGMGPGPGSVGGPPPFAGTRCTDSQGNVVLVQTGDSTAGYTNCTTQP